MVIKRLNRISKNVFRSSDPSPELRTHAPPVALSTLPPSPSGELLRGLRLHAGAQTHREEQGPESRER